MVGNFMKPLDFWTKTIYINTMKNRTFKKYANIASELYDIEIRLVFGGTGLGGNTMLAPTDSFKRKAAKLRHRYNKFSRNPDYLSKLYSKNGLTYEP